jgi:hypothetical protein
MATPTIDTSQLVKLATVFSLETRKKILANAGKRMGVAAESVVPDYPQASGNELDKFYTRDTVAGKKVTPYKSKFKSAAQAYYVLFVLGKGGQIPYMRSGTLGRSITSAISNLTGASVTVKIGTTIQYAQRVIGDDSQQSPYHKGTWWQLNEVMADNTTTIEREGQNALADGIEQELSRR